MRDSPLYSIMTPGPGDNVYIPFYEGGCVYSTPSKELDITLLKNPKMMADYLKALIYRQDSYCEEASMILFNHLNGITSRNLVCGPSGCGKSFLWECVKDIYPKILVVNSASLSKTGFNGDVKIHSFLQQLDIVNYPDADYIVVWDEFDKLVCPTYTSHDENVSAELQAELLLLVTGEKIPVKKGNDSVEVDTSKMTHIFCGSFAQKAEQLSSAKSSSGIGFGAFKNEIKPFMEELTLKDCIDFGLIQELAGRMTRLINVRPLNLDDYIFLITEFKGSPLKKIESLYGRKLHVRKKQLCEIAKEAFESGLGVRNATSQLQRIMDKQIFDSFCSHETKDISVPLSEEWAPNQ